MKTSNVRDIYPGRERTKKTKRGFRPTKYIEAPSLIEMMDYIFTDKIILFDKMPRNRTLNNDNLENIYYFIKNDSKYGAVRFVEEKLSPLKIREIDSYKALQYYFDGISNSVHWDKSINKIINVAFNKSDFNDSKFIKKILDLNIPDVEADQLKIELSTNSMYETATNMMDSPYIFTINNIRTIV